MLSLEKCAVFPGGYGQIEDIQDGRLRHDWGLKVLSRTVLLEKKTHRYIKLMSVLLAIYQHVVSSRNKG